MQLQEILDCAKKNSDMTIDEKAHLFNWIYCTGGYSNPLQLEDVLKSKMLLPCGREIIESLKK